VAGRLIEKRPKTKILCTLGGDGEVEVESGEKSESGFEVEVQISGK
jgi:hypothetical protein